MLCVRDLGGHLLTAHKVTLVVRIWSMVPRVAAVGALPPSIRVKLGIVRMKVPRFPHPFLSLFARLAVWYGTMLLWTAPAVLDLIDARDAGCDSAFYVGSLQVQAASFVHGVPSTRKEPMDFRELDLVSSVAPGCGSVHVMVLSAAEMRSFVLCLAQSIFLRCGFRIMAMQSGCSSM